MTPDKLAELSRSIASRHDATINAVKEIDPSSSDRPSTDHQLDAYAEALFLRAFTAYERDIERLFLHYVTGGMSEKNVAAHSHLSIKDEDHARRLTKAGQKFLSWAKPDEIRNKANLYLNDGWPISQAVRAKAQILSDCEKIRNRIAHNSEEAMVEFNAVQRNHLGTERLFDITPGQFLRVRIPKYRGLIISHLLGELITALNAIIDPPP